MAEMPRRARRLAVATTLASLVLFTGYAGAAFASDYDGDGYTTTGSPPDCNDLDPAIHPGALDLPDLQNEDTNCDGIDGDITKAVFVDAVTGQDIAPGSRDFPLKTITEGIQKAVSGHKTDVYVTGRTYAESLTPATGVSIYGGYLPGFTGARSAAQPTTVASPTPVAALANNVTGVTLQLLSLQPANAGPGGSSHGLEVLNGAKVALDHVTATGANGGAGITPGTPGQTANGGAGTQGNGGSCGAGGPGPAGGVGVNNGGAGGPGGFGGNNGLTGGNGAPFGSAGTGGVFGTGSSNVGNATGNNGGPGNNGSSGAAGTSAALPAVPAVLATGAPGIAGNSGGPGTGGGGGGGGGGANSNFGPLVNYNAGGGSGGSGGGGGTGGAGGNPGGGGGGSFGVYIVDGSVVARDSTLTGGTGGAGGNGSGGGPGGSGGAGGDGGPGSGCGDGGAFNAHGGTGGRGGTGGPGGPGGPGSGGTGGPSAGVFAGGPGSSYSIRNTAQTSGTPGVGGKIGGNGAVSPSGPAGTAGLLKTAQALQVDGDFDGDGIFDKNDACPNIPAGPIDANHDGCPDRPPALADSDGDRIPDIDDACPTVPAGPNDANHDGCPDPQPSPGGGRGTGQPEQILITLTWNARAGTKSTKFTSLRIRNIPLGATVHVTCKGKSCPKGLKGKGYTKKNAFGALNLKKFIKKPFKAGVKITVIVSKPNAINAVKILTVRKHKSPSITTRCIRPGSTKQVACA